MFPEYGYVMKYAELHNDKGRRGLEPWSLRQLAFYHQYDMQTKQSAYVLITPVPPSKSIALDKLTGFFESLETVSEFQQDWLNPNELLLQAYLGNWRDYMYDHESRLDHLVSMIEV